MPTRYCPHCEADISDSYQEAEPDVGIMASGWYCDACDTIIEEDEQGFENGEAGYND